MYITVFVFNTGKCAPRLNKWSKREKRCVTGIHLTSSFTFNGRLEASGADCLGIVSAALVLSRTAVECLAC